MILLRLIYFLAIGWWAGLLVSLLGLLLTFTIIGMPLGLMMLNRLPGVLFLREPGEPCPDGYDHRHLQEELPFLLRALWFFLLGWELGICVVVAGYLLCLTLIGIPLGIYILNRLPLLMTLSRHYD